MMMQRRLHLRRPPLPGVLLPLDQHDNNTSCSMLQPHKGGWAFVLDS